MCEIIDIGELQEARRMTKLEFEARREYLEGYASLVRQIKATEMELAEIEAAIGPGASATDGMPRSGKVTDGSDRIINRMEHKRRLCAKIKREMAQMEKARDEIVEVICTTSQDRLQEVLRYRYIMDMDIGQIAEAMHYSYRQVQNIHNRAVQRIKPPARVIMQIKAELMEEHADWAEIEQKRA